MKLKSILKFVDKEADSDNMLMHFFFLHFMPDWFIFNGMVWCCIQKGHISRVRSSSHSNNNRLLGEPYNLQWLESKNA